MNEYKLSRTKSKQMPKMSLYSGLLKKLKEDSRNTMIEKIKNELKDLKNMLNKIKELELSREQEINKIKNETKRELNMLHDEISDILEKLDVNVTTLKLRCGFREKPHDFEKERELRLLAKEKINEIELLDHLLNGETKISKLLTDLEYEKHNTLHDITISASKLIELAISPTQINEIKDSILLS